MGEEDNGRAVLRHKLLIERLNSLGHDQKEVVELYDQWGSSTYDEDAESSDRNGLLVFAKSIAQLYTGDRDTAKILDVAAGTGSLAEQLLKEGFKRMDALDPSSGMLEAAKEKKCYLNYICALMEDVGDTIENDHYDIACSMAAIAAGHLTTEALNQMYYKTKPGGLVGICGRKSTWDSEPEYNVRMRGAITQLTEAGKVVIEQDIVIEKYFRPERPDWQQGVLIIMRKI